MEVVQLPVYSLGLRRRPCHPHGRRASPAGTRCWCRGSSIPSGCRSSATTASRVEMARPYRRRARWTTITKTGRLDLRRSRSEDLGQDRRGLFRIAVLSRPDRGRRRGDRAHRARARRGDRSSAPIRFRSASCRPPADYGADIAVGPTQPLGVHMNCGGGVGGFIASRDEEKLRARVQRLPRSASPARRKPGEYGFALVLRRIRPPTACASRARTGPATRSISGPSPMRSTCRCSGRRASARWAS